jgi:hypothetical protein
MNEDKILSKLSGLGRYLQSEPNGDVEKYKQSRADRARAFPWSSNLGFKT